MIDYKIKGTRLPNYYGVMEYRMVSWNIIKSNSILVFDLNNYISYGHIFFNSEDYIIADLENIGSGRKDLYMFKLSDLNNIPKDEFVLPDTWHIMINDDNRDILSKWYGSPLYPECLGFAIGMVRIRQRGKFVYKKKAFRPNEKSYRPDYIYGKEINTEQFIEYVVNRQIGERKIIEYRCKSQFLNFALDLAKNEIGDSSYVSNWTIPNDINNKFYKIFYVANVLNTWFDAIWAESVLYFGTTKFIIRNDSAETCYGEVSKKDIKKMLDYIDNPPSLSGLSIDFRSEGKINLTKYNEYHYCMQGSYKELLDIYKAFR